MEGLRKTTKNLSQDSRTFHEYNSEALPLVPTRWVTTVSQTECCQGNFNALLGQNV